MNFSPRIARIRGIDVYLHWTFLIFIGWLLISNLNKGGNMAENLMSVWFILAIFGCVLLHELGHALAGMRYGIKTKNILLLPIGGVASMEKMPEKPAQELVVALAGPAVNLVIMILLIVYFQIAGGYPATPEEVSGNITSSNFLMHLLAVNGFLALFNLIPAFPMDGGRVLRALLAMRHTRAKATAIAASVGQILAIAFVFIGFFYNPMLIFIGLFIFLGAGAETNFESTRSVLSNYQVKDVLMHQFTTLHAFEKINKAIATLLDGQEKEFLVEQDNKIIGYLTRDDIIRGLQEKGQEASVGHIAQKNILVLSPDMPLQEAYEKMSQQNLPICPVMENGQLLGVLDMENIVELVMLEKAGMQRGVK